MVMMFSMDMCLKEWHRNYTQCEITCVVTYIHSINYVQYKRNEKFFFEIISRADLLLPLDIVLNHNFDAI